MHIPVLEFFIDTMEAEDFAQKRILEAGSKRERHRSAPD